MPFNRPNIISAVTDREAEKLQELAEGKRVLELGAHFGFSTVVLAQSAYELHSVDWHMGDPQAGLGDNLLEWRHNLRRFEVESRVRGYVGRFEDILPALKPRYFDGCFLDGEHSEAPVTRDLQLLLPLVKSGGWIAFHDYGRFDVAAVVDRYAKTVGVDVQVVDWLAWVTKP